MAPFVGPIVPKDQITPVVKKAKVAKLLKVSLPRLSAAKANQLIEENNILLRAVADKIGLNLEEVLCPITKKYSPTYDDEDIFAGKGTLTSRLLALPKTTTPRWAMPTKSMCPASCSAIPISSSLRKLTTFSPSVF